MTKFYVGPIGYEYNDEGYNTVSEEDTISSVMSVYDTHRQAQVAVDALTVDAVRAHHYVYAYMIDDWADKGVRLADLSDEEILAKLDAYVSYHGGVQRLYGIING